MNKVVSVTFNGSPVNYEVECPLYFKSGSMIVCEWERGLELAKVVKKNHLPKQNKKEESDALNIKFVRRATDKDIADANANKIEAERIKALAKQKILENNLEMKLDFVFLSLDKSKISIYFTSEERVDFRNLVKELAAMFKSRIELIQVGARDETRYVGGFGPCGKPCCCKQFLNGFDQVTIKMAKNQNLSLNPTKISGLCGRLMCCLSYENEHYAETNALMPKVKSMVSTPNGTGTVVFNDLLKRQVTVKFGDETTSELKVFDLNDIKKIKDKK